MRGKATEDFKQGQVSEVLVAFPNNHTDESKHYIEMNRDKSGRGRLGKELLQDSRFPLG